MMVLLMPKLTKHPQESVLLMPKSSKSVLTTRNTPLGISLKLILHHIT